MGTDGGGSAGPEESAGRGHLVAVVRRAKAGLATPQEVFEAFLDARVYCERPENPGFLAVEAPESMPQGPRSRISDFILDEEPGEPAPAARLVPLFSSLEQLSLYAGECAYFSTTGADVLDLLPPELDLWLDPAADHAVRLATSAVEIAPVLTISYGNGNGNASKNGNGSDAS